MSLVVLTDLTALHCMAFAVRVGAAGPFSITAFVDTFGATFIFHSERMSRKQVKHVMPASLQDLQLPTCFQSVFFFFSLILVYLVGVGIVILWGRLNALSLLGSV